MVPGAPSDAGSGETDLDVEQSGAIAPAPTSSSTRRRTPTRIRRRFLHRGQPERRRQRLLELGRVRDVPRRRGRSGRGDLGYVAAFDEAFLEFAAQGQAGFVSAGDSAAYDASGDLGTTNLSVDTPGDSPYITSAGGTTLPWSGTLSGTTSTGATVTANVQVTQQRAWGWDYLWAPVAAITGLPESEVAEDVVGVVGGGGGFSQVEPTPSYQQGVRARTSSAPCST